MRLHKSVCSSVKSPRGFAANVLDRDSVVRGLELQSHCYVIFQTNILDTLEKGMNHLITPTGYRLK